MEICNRNLKRGFARRAAQPQAGEMMSFLRRSIGSLSKSKLASTLPFSSASQTGASRQATPDSGLMSVVSNGAVACCPMNIRPSCLLSRSFVSTTSKEPAKKEVVTVEDDPFDSPTYHIPEKPVTFTEGASYSFVILAGLAVAGASGYAVFKELMFQPKEYKIFDKALKRIQDDGQVRVRIGSPITGYGQETRNRAARQRIPNKVITDEDGVEHVEVNFFIRGPHGAGKVYHRDV
ncbi:unnamed protein product [Brassica oleracea]|uniref:Mitochondrial import inner membrane translocase subunit Tim21 n=2 Tax=Brassica oleracea TaxID=3712 RepID=A0A0D3DT31_BRAOL|nr:PREDICTED: probable mitochondrial import inner membrane translocase subunit TIM21 [Brassica oleracea var. oleracea]VDD57369.1 unnamed protein product [Brassica oleracea]